MLNNSVNLIAVCGPTASGKTRLAVNLALRYTGEIVSADSRQVYRGMDIGTAKPDPDTLAEFPHRLIDIRDPGDPYSAAEFRRDALDAVERSLSAGRIPLITGGTMFYLSALINGLSELPEADERLRESILERAARQGWAALHEQLAGVDPEMAASIRPADRQRLQRAHEILLATKRLPSEVLREARPAPIPHPILHLAVFLPRREDLHRRIESRFHGMLERGLLEEVERLRRHPSLTADSASMRTVGYRQAWKYLDGTGGFDEFVAGSLAATRQLAKRQLTWMRQTAGLLWYDASGPKILYDLLTCLEQRVARR